MTNNEQWQLQLTASAAIEVSDLCKSETVEIQRCPTVVQHRPQEPLTNRPCRHCRPTPWTLIVRSSVLGLGKSGVKYRDSCLNLDLTCCMGALGRMGVSNVFTQSIE